MKESSLLSDKERMLIYKVNIDDKAIIYCDTHCIHARPLILFMFFFPFYTMKAGHIEREAGGDGRDTDRVMR